MTHLTTVAGQVVDDLLPGAAVSWEPDRGGRTIRVEAGGELVCTAYVSNDVATREAVAHIANVVQDAAVERRGLAVPDCPGHPHAAVLRTTEHGVAWACPATGATLREYAVPDGPVAH